MAWAKSIGFAAVFAVCSASAQAEAAPPDIREFWYHLNRADGPWLFVPAESHATGPPVLITLIRGEIPTVDRAGPLWITLPIKMPKVIACRLNSRGG